VRPQSKCRHQSPNPPANQRAESREADPCPEASTQDAQAGINRLGLGPAKQTRAGEDPDSRALLRLSSRSPSGIVKHPKKPMLSWPSPLRGQPARLLGFRPPLARFPTRLRLPLPKEQARFRIAAPQGVSSRTWERLRRATPTSLRSPTSSACLPIPSGPQTRQRPGESAVELLR
jgi:hypothetical protein